MFEQLVDLKTPDFPVKKIKHRKEIEAVFDDVVKRLRRMKILSSLDGFCIFRYAYSYVHWQKMKADPNRDEKEFQFHNRQVHDLSKALLLTSASRHGVVLNTGIKPQNKKENKP
jgi:hypothetical protein